MNIDLQSDWMGWLFVILFALFLVYMAVEYIKGDKEKGNKS